MGQKRVHKQCVQDIHNKLKLTHQCHKEYPLFRDGNVHFIDTVGFPHKDKPHLKPIAVECESGSGKPQQESNMNDLIEFRRRYPDAEIFQVNHAEQIDFNKLRKINGPGFSKPISKGFSV